MGGSFDLHGYWNLKTQEEILNDLRVRLGNMPEKKEQIKEILDFIIIYADSYGAKIIPLIEEAIDMAKEHGDPDGELIGYFTLYFTTAVTQSGIRSKYLLSLEDLATRLENIKHLKETYSFGLNYMAYFHWFKGEYEKGFDLAFEGIRCAEDNDLSVRGWHYFGLGICYFDTKDLDNSKIYYQKAFDRFKIENNIYGRARSATGLGTVAVLRNQLQEAGQHLQYAADIYRELGHHAGLSRTLNDMGLLEKSRNNYKLAIQYLNESIQLRKELNHVQGLVTSYTDLGETFLRMKNYRAALESLQKGLALAIDVNSQQKQMRVYKLLYDTFKELNDTESALRNFEHFYDLRSQLLSDEASNNIKRVQTKYEKEKSEREAEIERLRNIELKKANEEIAAQHNEIKKQKFLIEMHRKEILDSINYAKRIQEAILPPADLIKAQFPESFILYKPKDIVAGDFYWLEKFGDTILIAAADCTGHGVPGAMVSVVCSNALNRAVKEFGLLETGEILDKVTDLVLETFEKSRTDVRDGMDISLLSVNRVKQQIQWSGANNPLWYFENGQACELVADKQPIGKSDYRKPFTTHTIAYKTGAMFYLFTDGYADQFGGPKGKKFKYRQLQTLISALQNERSSTQQKMLSDAFENWKGELEQVDDVCIVGVRV